VHGLDDPKQPAKHHVSDGCAYDADYHDCAHPGDHALVTGDRADAERSPGPFLCLEADRQQDEDQRSENPVEDDQDTQSDAGRE